jgi:predicted transposase/invertase (TIGR01784 family)
MNMLEISPQEQARYNEFARRKAENDYEHDMAMSERIGEKRGALNAALQIAKRFLDRGMSINEIAEDTGLTEQQINDLKNEKM